MNKEVEELNQKDDVAVFGFWVYLMTDLIMFAVLFATFAVLRGKTFGGPPESELYNLFFVLTQTLLLLTSSFAVGLALVSAKANKLNHVIIFLLVTFVLGIAFLGMEIFEFRTLISEGHTWQTSASLSSFFALVGMHGIHIAAGLFWLVIIIFYIINRGINRSSIRKLILFGIFWHFLDLVWIFIFTIVYLMGSLI